MKQLILIISIGIMFFSCHEKTVPRTVKIHFLELEPSAYKIYWKIDKEIYEVAYVIDSKNANAYFDTNGNWLETEYEIAIDELPEAILKTIETKLNDYSIIDIELVKTKESQLMYEVDLKKNDKIYDILFSISGKILRKKI